jgi:hypothetical protein
MLPVFYVAAPNPDPQHTAGCVALLEPDTALELKIF